ncbi:MAG: hypothetical protein AAF488_00900 [Planctomycetota bacterium]
MRYLLLVFLPCALTLATSWWTAGVALAANQCVWEDMDPDLPGTQEVVDYGDTTGCGAASIAEYSQVSGCPCGMTVSITVAVEATESWSILSTDPATGDHVLIARGTGNPVANPVIVQVNNYDCGSKLKLSLVVSCPGGTTSAPVSLQGVCGTECE